ncbi:MAG: tetratricopeptide repeat protein [Pirellulales bacterium]|nr:tetratricopeptide repeat protein [Pirellulales bacterium]
MRSRRSCPAGVLLPAIVAITVSWAAAAPVPVLPSEPAAKPRETASAPDSRLAPLVLEEKPEPLVPKRAPTVDDRDRLEALAMFSAARMLESQGKETDALRLYQRAFRYDPHAATLARQIVVLAYRKDRHAEAVRYAFRLIDLEKPDPLLLNQLAMYLTDQGEWDRAIDLYRNALSADSEGSRGTGVLLRMQMGRLYHLVEKYDQAAECFDAVLNALKDPDSAGLDEQVRKVLLGDPAPTYNLIGEAFLLAGRSKEAAAAFENGHKADPKQGLLSYHLARVDMRLGKPEDALVKLEAYFAERLSTEAMEPYRLLADVLKALGRPKELVPRLESLHAKDNANVPLAYSLAEQYREAGELEKAEKLYRELMARAPTTVGYRSLIDLYRKTGKTENLLEILGESVARTASLEPLGAEGKAIAEDVALVEKLIQAARQQYKARPTDFVYGRRLAIALLALDTKKYDDAEEFFLLAIEAKPDQAVQSLLTWGLELLVDEQYSRAVDVFQRGAQHESKAEEQAVFHFYLAAALEMDGRTDDALAAARAGAKLQPDDPRFLGRVGWVLYHSRRNTEASNVYRELVEKHDSDHGSSEAREVLREARFVLSNIAVAEEKFPEAEEWLEQVLDEFPDDVGAMNDLGYLWADRNEHLHRAHRMIRTAAEKEPDNAAYRDSLGWVLYRMGRLEEAVAELEKAVALDPDPVVLDHLGDACRDLKKSDKAVESWRKAAERFKEKGEADKAARMEKKVRELKP